MNKWDKRHLRDMSRYEQMVANLFSIATTEAAKIGPLIGALGEKPFSWTDFPLAQNMIQAIMSELGKGLLTSIVNGVRSQWTLSNNKNNELCQQVFGDLSHKLPKAAADRYFNNHHTALEAFISRRDSSTGLSLSDKVWNYTNQFKSEIESALDIGIRSGRSADELSRDLRDYLKHPDKLFRRVRDEHGQLHLSQNAKAFHPGQGVARSSYVNARRLAATETNIAYRTADHLRWQELDFVVGIKIQLSNNHTCKGVPAGAYYDICDELKGDYPKDFKFTGWHPHCRCIATSILKTEEELMADNERILNGEDVSTTSVNEVKELPDNFTKWMADNKERIDRAKSMPYFIKDNKGYFEKYISQSIKVANQYGTDKYFGQGIIKKVKDKYADFKYLRLRDYNEIKDQLSYSIRKNLGYDVEVEINQEYCNLNTAKAFASELDKLTSRYRLEQAPVGKIIIGYKPNNPNEYGEVEFDGISKKILKLTSNYDPLYPNKAINGSRCEEHRNPIAVCTHEFGHLLYQVRNYVNPDLRLLDANIKSIFTEYQSECSKLISDNDMVKLSEVFIGINGHKSINEFVADAFQEYINCKKPSPYAIKIGEILDSWFMR